MSNPVGWVSLSFDDALEQHLDVAIPAMNAAGIHGTFYAHLASPCFIRRLEEWKRAAAAGHELGNHTVFHPADQRKTWVRPGNAIDHYSVDRMRLELEFANDWLHAIDGESHRTFAYPCSNTKVGHVGWGHKSLRRFGWDRTRLSGWVDRWQLDFAATQQSYEPIIGELFLAGRAGGLELGDPVPLTQQWCRTRLLSAAVDRWTLTDIQKFVTSAIDRRTWAILQFHGVGGGHRMDCSAAIFLEFVGWLKSELLSQVVTVREGANRLWGSHRAGNDAVAAMCAGVK